MAINAVGTNEIEQFHGRIQDFGKPFMNREKMNVRNGSPMDKAEMSVIGQFFSNIHSELSEEEKSEVKEFLGKLRDSVSNGTFDAAALAEEAPDSLKALAEQEGINLEDLLNTLSQGPPRMKRGGKMMNSQFDHPFMTIMSELSPENRAEVRDFFSTAKSDIASGNFDIESLIGQAPQSLLDIAELKGIDLNDLLTNMAAGFAERRSA